MTDLFQEPGYATPLEASEREGLLQSWITDRRDLNVAEQENIVAGAAWARRRRIRASADLLNDNFTKTLHKQMFGQVWKWAGTYRKTERNIGIETYRIPAEVPVLFSDACYWVEHATYAPDDVAVRLHHRLVAIHPFPNGNGRHARLMADLLIDSSAASLSVGAAAALPTPARCAPATSWPSRPPTITTSARCWNLREREG